MFSLFQQLTTLPPPGFPATDLIKLSKVVAHDACSVKHHVLTAYMLINGLIAVIGGSDDATSWYTFGKFTTAVGSLEECAPYHYLTLSCIHKFLPRCLFDIASSIEKDIESFLPDDMPVVDLINSIRDWQKTRTELRKALRNLLPKPLTVRVHLVPDVEFTIPI
jgi:hypothetical protein